MNASEATSDALLVLVEGLELTEPAHIAAREKLVAQIAKNAMRIDYRAFLARGLQIGSGAMESIHRSGSQVRLKLSGARWLEETSQAVLQLRMLELSGRWDEFWNRPDLPAQLVRAFKRRPANHPTLEAA